MGRMLRTSQQIALEAWRSVLLLLQLVPTSQKHEYTCQWTMAPEQKLVQSVNDLMDHNTKSHADAAASNGGNGAQQSFHQCL
jgi:hypothetical protein